jgi:dGTPase
VLLRCGFMALARLLYSTMSRLINDYIQAAELADTDSGVRVKFDPDMRADVEMLKQLTWRYVILNPALTTQQYGQRRVIRELFTVFMEAAHSDAWTMFPPRYEEELRQIEQEGTDKDREKTRMVVDLIASMTEQQALKMHQRLVGTSLGSILDPTTAL